jgi:hypothetical protein
MTPDDIATADWDKVHELAAAIANAACAFRDAFMGQVHGGVWPGYGALGAASSSRAASHPSIACLRSGPSP